MEAPSALPVDVPGIVSGGKEPLSFTFAPPTGMPETCGGRPLWSDRPVHLAGKTMGTDQISQSLQEPSPVGSEFLSVLARFKNSLHRGLHLRPSCCDDKIGIVSGQEA
jgi:hypothetical protein